MEYLFIVVLILTIIIACALFFINKFNELNEISIKMNKAQDNISNLLQEKYSKMYDCYKIIKKNIKKKDYLKDFNELKIDKLTTYELDTELNNYYDLMSELKETYKSLNTKDYKKLLEEVVDISEKIIASEKYFNKYNNVLIKKITGFNKLIANIGKIKVKTSYEIKEPTED